MAHWPIWPIYRHLPTLGPRTTMSKKNQFSLYDGSPNHCYHNSASYKNHCYHNAASYKKTIATFQDLSCLASYNDNHCYLSITTARSSIVGKEVLPPPELERIFGLTGGLFIGFSKAFEKNKYFGNLKINILEMCTRQYFPRVDVTGPALHGKTHSYLGQVQPLNHH